MKFPIYGNNNFHGSKPPTSEVYPNRQHPFLLRHPSRHSDPSHVHISPRGDLDPDHFGVDFLRTRSSSQRGDVQWQLWCFLQEKWWIKHIETMKIGGLRWFTMVSICLIHGKSFLILILVSIGGFNIRYWYDLPWFHHQEFISRIE